MLVFTVVLQMCPQVSLIGSAHYNFMFCIPPCKAAWHCTSLSGPGFQVGRLMCSSPNEAFLSLPCLFCRGMYDFTVSLLLLGSPNTAVLTGHSSMALHGADVILMGSSLHSWGEVCRHSSEDQSSLETDSVNVRTVVALERVVVCCVARGSPVIRGNTQSKQPYGSLSLSLSLSSCVH